jgi:signal transduction histidine kinase
LDTAKRTVLFRVAQEALTNVARHAQASRVEVVIQKLAEGICMRIEDDGISFQVDRVLHGKGGKHLGLLGMRERLEMVGGGLAVESAPGRGSSIIAQIPSGDSARKGR